MDVEELVNQLSPKTPLPGVALLVARDVLESAVIIGTLDEATASWLAAAAEHLRQVREQCAELVPHASLPDHLVAVANPGPLLTTAHLERIRSTLCDLVQVVPAEGSVRAGAGYAGF